MIVTEEEAKRIRCQESYAARVTDEEGGNVYVEDKSVAVASLPGAAYKKIAAGPYTCIGSRCMAWTWEGWRETNTATGEVREILLHKDIGPTDGLQRDHVGRCGKCR